MNIKKQKGVVLIVSLVMLLILTLTGMSGMQMTKLDEKMASNHYEKNIAFQATETALKQAEAWISASATEPEANDAPVAGQVWNMNKPQEITVNWADKAKWVSKGTRTIGIQYVSEQPLYFIEKLSRNLYRITAKGTGRTGEAQIILQSTYARTF